MTITQRLMLHVQHEQITYGERYEHDKLIRENVGAPAVDYFNIINRAGRLTNK